MVVALLCVFGCIRRWTMTFDALLLMLDWSTNDFLFFVSPFYTDTHEYFNSHNPGRLFGINLSLFLQKIFFAFRCVWNVTLNPNFHISFLFFCPIFGIQVNVTVVFLSLLLLLLLIYVFFLKLCFLIIFIFAKHISQIFYFCPQIFSRTDIGGSFKKYFEYAGNCTRGYARMWLDLYIRESWFAINSKFISLIVIFCFYVKKV